MSFFTCYSGAKVEPKALKNVKVQRRVPNRKPREKKIKASQHDARAPTQRSRDPDYQEYLQLISDLNSTVPDLPFLQSTRPSLYRPVEVIAEHDQSLRRCLATIPSVVTDNQDFLIPSYEEEVYTTPGPSLVPEPASITEKLSTYLSSSSGPCASGLVPVLIYSAEQRSRIELCTRGQADNPLWFKYRGCMVTASNFHQVHTRMRTVPAGRATDAAGAISVVMGRTNFLGNASTEYGKRHESVALQEFLRDSEHLYEHSDVQASESGLWVDAEYGFIGASPDSIVTCSCCGEYLVEIKCPSSISHSTVELDYRKTGFLHQVNGDIVLKKSHKYYTQVQGQMGVTGHKECAFIVWTPQGYVKEVVPFDPEFWRSVRDNIVSFFHKFLAVELLGLHGSTSMPDNRTGSGEQKSNDSEADYLCGVCREVVLEPDAITDDNCASVGCECKCGCDTWCHWQCVDFVENEVESDWMCECCEKKCCQ
jgi:hypothetical protein